MKTSYNYLNFGANKEKSESRKLVQKISTQVKQHGIPCVRHTVINKINNFKIDAGVNAEYDKIYFAYLKRGVERKSLPTKDEIVYSFTVEVDKNLHGKQLADAFMNAHQCALLYSGISVNKIAEASEDYIIRPANEYFFTEVPMNKLTRCLMKVNYLADGLNGNFLRHIY